MEKIVEKKVDYEVDDSLEIDFLPNLVSLCKGPITFYLMYDITPKKNGPSIESPSSL